MFGKHEFRVKVVNTSKEAVVPLEPQEDLIDKTIIVVEVAKRLIWTAAGAAVTYVAADTLRRVAVELAKK